VQDRGARWVVRVGSTCPVAGGTVS